VLVDFFVFCLTLRGELLDIEVDELIIKFHLLLYIGFYIMSFCRLSSLCLLFNSMVSVAENQRDLSDIARVQKTTVMSPSLYSINTGSFLYHAFPKNKDSNQYFDNRLFSIERQFHQDSDYSVIAGTFLNSQDHRCVLLGVRKDWYRLNDQTVIKGVYAYAGEFFFDTFEHCGDDGFYETMKDHTGVGFAPYLYHAVQYNFVDYWGVEAGLMLPGILVMSMQWRF